MSHQYLLSWFFATLLFSNCTPNDQSQQSTSQWTHIFTNDADGTTLHGNKEDLLAVVRGGYPLRIGYGAKRNNGNSRSIEHVADAQFLSIVDGTEVFAQIAPIIGQRPLRSQDTIGVDFREGYQWSIIVGSNGYSDRININAFQDSVAGHNVRPTKVSWFALVPSDVTHSGTPLW